MPHHTRDASWQRTTTFSATASKASQPTVNTKAGSSARWCTSPSTSRKLIKVDLKALSLDQREGEFPVQLGVIDIRDVVIGEPAGPILVFTNRNRTALAVIVDGHAAEVTLEATQLGWLETACSGAAHRPIGSRG